MRLFFLVFVAFVLSACSSSSQKPLYAIALTSEGVGSISATTAYNLQSIAPLLPGFDFKVFQTPSGKQELLRVFYHGQEWMQIEPTKDKKSIAAIYVLSKEIEHSCRVEGTKVCHDTEKLHYLYKDGKLKQITLNF